MLTLGITPLLAQPARAQDALVVTPAFDPARWIAQGEPIELRLSRPVVADSGRLAVFVGHTDVTALFGSAPDRLTYQSGSLRLPAGESELIVYLIDRGEQWSGFEQAKVEPRLAVSNKGQMVEGHAPADNRPPRAHFQDFTLDAGTQSVHVRDGWSLRSQLKILGATNRQEALRFNERQVAAPKVDLSDYAISLERGPLLLSLGHQSFGSHRYLLNALPSRGASASFRMGRAARLSVAALNGTSIVGWTNPLGLSLPKHRLVAGTLGLELVPARPGMLQLEVSVLDGSVLPRTGFTQGAITDAEESRGTGVRLTAQDPTQRFRLEAGFARSRFVNPADPNLGSDTLLVRAKEVSRNARFLDATVDVLRGVSLTPSLPARLGVTFRHERVDPLYRTVAQSPRADLLQNGVELNGGLGSVAVQFGLARSSDNLDDITGILKTRTNTGNASLTLPLATWLAERAAARGGGGALRWRVLALDADGSETMRSAWRTLYLSGMRPDEAGAGKPSDAATGGDVRSSTLEALVTQWEGTIRKAALKYGLVGPDYEEVAQDVRVRLWRAIEHHEKDPSALTAAYAYRAATSAAIDLVRRRRAEHSSRRVPLDAVEESVATDPPGADEQDLMEAVERALARVVESRRPAVRLHLSGRHLDEIATIMGWTRDKARNLLYRGLNDLRIALRDEGWPGEST